MTSLPRVTGLILAGGAGRRVGCRDKGLIQWRGKPLVAHVAHRLQPQVEQLLISCNRNSAQYQHYAKTTMADTRRDFQGPLAGLEAAAPYVDTKYLVVVPCDNPGLPGDLVQRLLAPLLDRANTGADISYAHDGERGQYLCAAMHRECLTSVTAYLDAGHRTVRHWYQSQQSVAVDFSDEAQCFCNFNHLN